jgi:hypothetical protein
MGVHDFYSDDSVEAKVHREVDGGHPASSDQFLKLVTPVDKFAG